MVEALYSGKSLEPKHRNHALSGQYKNRRECHIEPDWLLIYQITDECLLLERTGTRSDLFG
ncbi:MAG: type II toxin-antitoxin system YafQ family toxin [Verrucomicrobiota bacterium]